MRDALNLSKHLNIFRVLNVLGLYFSYWLSRLLRRPLIVGLPFSVSIEPTTACNLSCPECPSGLKQFTRATGKLTAQTHQQLLDQIAGSVFYINYYFQGEPFLHPDFLDFIKEAKKRKIYTATSTNAHFIDQKMAEEIVKSSLDRLIISIDGLTQETYESYRVDGKLEKVIAACRYLVEAKKELKATTPHLIFQFLAVRLNEHEIPSVFQLAKELGIDEVRIKTAQLYDYAHGNPLMPKNPKYSRYVLGGDGRYRLKYKTGNHCWRMWSSAVFTWDGKMLPCCFDKDAKHVLGSVEKHTVREIWKSKAYTDFRKAILVGRNQIEICQNCSEGAKVWA